MIAVRQRPYLPDLTGFDRPWRLLAEHRADLQVRELGFGTGYLAHTSPTAPVRTRRRQGR
jgi:hypothetical protein